MFDTNELVAELQGLRDDGYLSDALVRHAVRKISEGDERYDWVGAYLLNTEANELWLHNYMGIAALHSKIPVGEGVCGTAVAEAANQNVPDVSKVENYLACNADVKSELVVLIRAGDEIYGQIDLDSHTVGAFTEEDEAAVQSVTEKLAEQFAEERR